jgi:hypothetical protein
MASKVASYLQIDTSDSEVLSLILCALNSGIALCNSRRWHKLTAQSDMTMAANDDDISLPTDFKEPMSVFTVNSSDNRTNRLPHKPLQTLLVEQEDNSTAGTPRAYAIDYKNRNLILDIQPSSAWVSQNPELRVFYHRRLTELSQSSSTIDAEPEWDWFLIWHARREMAAIRDPDKFGLADRMAEQFWRQLIRNDTDQMSDWDDRLLV